MTTLAPAEILHYRHITVSNNLDDITDAFIQASYDRALVFGDDSDQTEARTAVYILRDVIGVYALLTDLNGQIENERRSQLYDHAKEQLTKYEGLAGMGGAGIMTTGMLGLDIDATDIDEDAVTA